MNELKVAVVGAGISGLTAALALHRGGVRVTVYEQASALVEIGAGLSVFANGWRVLDNLGVADHIKPLGARPHELIFRSWDRGERIHSEPMALGGRYEREFGQPYIGVLRSHVQRALVEQLPAEAIRLDHCLVDFAEEGSQVRLDWADGTSSWADLVIAADGARSATRTKLFGASERYSGTSGFRGIVPAAEVPSLQDPENLQFWVGPDAHLLHFPIVPEADLVTFLAVSESPRRWPRRDTWRIACTQEEALEPFVGWHPAVREMVDAASHSERWALFSVAPLDSWSRGRVALLGDSAHGMLPHHGQGANQGIEDAYLLAALLSSDRGAADPLWAVNEYEAHRKPHTAQVQAASWVANRFLHVPDTDAQRDSALKTVAEHYSWIHQHDVCREAELASN